MRWVKDKGNGDLRSRENHEPRRRRLYEHGAAFFVVSTAFLQQRNRDTYSCASENRLQRPREGPAQACVKQGEKGAGWARSGLCVVRRGRGRLRPSVAQSAEAPDRRTPSPTPCKQTPSMKGAGNADIGEAVNFFILRCTFQTNAINEGSGQRGYWGSSQFFYFTLHFYQKDCARGRQKNRSGREQLTPSPPIFDFDHGGCEHRQGAKR